jgi:hypothetical protein
MKKVESVEIICKECKKVFFRKPYLKRIFCSHKCQLNFIAYKGHPNFNNSPSELRKDWKGDKVGYRGLHYWLERKLGKPDKCEMCGEKKNRISWANSDHKYKRNIFDWRRLCPLCHAKYDREHNLRF